MKNCDEQINRYLLGLMGEEEEVDFQLHLMKCEECRKKLERARRLRGALVMEERDSIKMSNRIRYKVYYSVAAIVLLLIVSSVMIYQIENKDNEVMIAKVTDTAEMVIPLPQQANVVAKDSVTQSDTPLNHSKEIIKKGNKKDDKELVTIVQKGKHTPHTARVVVVSGGVASEESRSYVLPYQNLEFGEIINPSSVDTTYTMTNDSILEFKWNTYHDTPFFVYIKADGGVLENYYDNGDSFKLDMRKYKNNSTLEWNVKIMGESYPIRKKGILHLK